MNRILLSQALREKAAALRDVYYKADDDNVIAATADDIDVLRNARFLIQTLAHLVDGKPIERAFGSPGDWGYSTSIGKALCASPAAFSYITADNSTTDNLGAEG